MGTASFLDRLRRTGPLRPERAREHGALGPVGRASGFGDDVRRTRPYDAYPALGLGAGEPHAAGDALARLRVRWQEVRQSFHLIRQAADELGDAGDGAVAGPMPGRGRPGGRAGRRRRRARCSTTCGSRAGASSGAAPGRPRSTTWCCSTRCSPGDILTDFPFIEASFGLSVAGVAL